MIRELLFVPIVAALLLGTLFELEALGEDTAARTVAYATDAVAALDCAYDGRPLTDCAPGILNSEFDDEVRRTNAILEDLQRGTRPSR